MVRYLGPGSLIWVIPAESLVLTESFVRNADALIENVARAVVAPDGVIRHSVVSLLAGGHLLLNDLPGVGKTLLARCLAQSIGESFKRIQFNPDLLPTDVTGASVYHQADGRFEFVPGPIFANVVLADEVNRASTRTQSALLRRLPSDDSNDMVGGAVFVRRRPAA